MEIKGYKLVDYRDFSVTLGVLYAEYMDQGGTPFKLADELQVKSIQTISNCFSPLKQIVSDKTVTGLMSAIGLNGLVVWFGGERYYFIKNK